MAFLDLIAGLAFVNAHVGLYRLDKGLRDDINIPMEQLQAHVQLLTRSAQAVAITNQIQQLKRQADSLLKQQLNAQHAQLMVQVGQLQLQLQQLQVERTRLELEVKKEQRLAQENQILKIFVDLYAQSQSFRQQGRLLDYLVVVIAAFRIHHQIYYDLDDANNRLKVTELKDKLFQELSGILQSVPSRQKLVDSYIEALQVPIGLVNTGTHSISNALKAIDEEQKLRQVFPDVDWAEKVKSADFCIEYLEASRKALTGARTSYAEFTQNLDLREFFFPVYGDHVNTLVPGLEGAWAAWISSVEANIGNRLTQLYSAFCEHPPLFNQREKEVVAVIEEAKRLRITHQLGQAISTLVRVTQAYLARFQELELQFKELTIPKKDADPPHVLYICLVLQQIKAAISSEFSEFQRFAQSHNNLSNKQYLAQATRRMQEINATEDAVPVSCVPGTLALSQNITKLESAVNEAIKVCKSLLNRAAKSDELFEKLDAYSRKLLDEPQIQEVEARVVSYRPGAMGQILSGLRGDKGKDIERRHRLIDTVLEIYTETHPK